MPTGRISVAGQYQIWEHPIGQKRGGLGYSPALFGYFCAYKSTPSVGTGTHKRNPARGCGNPQRKSRRRPRGAFTPCLLFQPSPRAEYRRCRLSVLALEKQSHGAGAGVVADDRAHIVDNQLLHREFGLDGLTQLPGFVAAVTVADEHH